MRNTRLILLICSLILFVTACNTGSKDTFDPAEIKTVKNLTERHKKFIVDFYPAAVEANQHIMLQRAMLIDLRNDYRHVIIKKHKRDKLNHLADEYRFGETYFNDSTSRQQYVNQIDTLLYYVDYIPEKLVMAQAVIESGWGGSKFAREINNYFGIHCYTPGCGRPPANRENAGFWVKAFPTIEACIEEYLWVLNTGFAYKGLRLKRKILRQENNYPDAIELAKGLKRYSEKGNEYINLVNSIINDYLPENLDAFVRYMKKEDNPES